MPKPLIPTSEILTLLAKAPPRIAAFTAGLTREQLQAAPGPGEWSANEVLAHLRACADQWGGSILAIATQNVAILRAVNPRTWIKQTGYLEQNFRDSLAAYTSQRSDLLVVLEHLSAEDWQRTATVTGAGKGLVRSVQFYGDWLAHHERPHLKQIERISQVMRSR